MLFHVSTGAMQIRASKDAFNTAHLINITNPNLPADVQDLPNMRYKRGFADAVVLPDGKVLITGGQKRSLVFTNTDSALPAEVFDPATRTFTTLAEERVPRNYYSVSILLADGTVFSGGGGLCYVGGGRGSDDAGCDRSADHADGQIFSPPYLFNSDGTPAAQPTISSISTGKAKAGEDIVVQMDHASESAAFALVRMGSSTHSINSDQRRIAMRLVQQEGNHYTITLPSDPGVLITGYYYVFAIGETGVPSIARTLQVVL